MHITNQEMGFDTQEECKKNNKNFFLTYIMKIIFR